MSNYYDLLKDDRWLNKREEILIRDNYKCVSCNNKADDLPAIGNKLHVHHIVYKKGLKPWEYDDDDLITLCDECHKYITEKINSCIVIIRRMCIDDDVAEQLEFLLKIISEINNPWKIRDFGKNISKHIEQNG